MLLKKSFSIVDQNFPRPLMRFSDKICEGPRPLVKKITGGFDNGLGANRGGSLAALPFEKIRNKAFSDFFNSINPLLT